MNRALSVAWLWQITWLPPNLRGAALIRYEVQVAAMIGDTPGSWVSKYNDIGLWVSISVSCAVLWAPDPPPPPIVLAILT